MSASYAGDQLQALAQGWLLATTTGSALAVGHLSLLSSIPLLLLPLSGALVERADRRRVLLVGQVVGAVTTTSIAVLVLMRSALPRHVYAWTLVSGLVSVASRPAYKAALTDAVSAAEVRGAVALNAMTETAAILVVSLGGAALLSSQGLLPAFLLNVITYVAAAAALTRVTSPPPDTTSSPQQLRREVAQGVAHLLERPMLLRPLLLTVVTVACCWAPVAVLPALVHRSGASLTQLGLLGAGSSAGAFAGATFAGIHGPGPHPTRTYASLGLLLALSTAALALLPVGVATLLALTVNGFFVFAQAVWNTTRVRHEADASYQVRLQALTSLAFPAGIAASSLWAGPVVDRFGMVGLSSGAALLALISVVALLATTHAPPAPSLPNRGLHAPRSASPPRTRGHRHRRGRLEVSR